MTKRTIVGKGVRPGQAGCVSLLSFVPNGITGSFIERYHDIGGDPAGRVPGLEPNWVDWERRVEAMRNLLGDSTRRLLSLDDTCRGFESFGIEKYRSLSFYRRRL